MPTKIWTFIRDNLLTLATVIIGVAVLIARGLGMGSPDLIAGTTLLLITALATSELVERAQRLSKIEDTLEEQRKLFAQGVERLLVTEMETDKAFEHMRGIIMNLEQSFVLVASEPRRSSDATHRRPYEDALLAKAAEGKIRILWLSSLTGHARVTRARKFIVDFPDNDKIFIGHLEQPQDSPPVMSFFVFDDELVAIRAPFTRGGHGRYLFIRSKPVANLFLQYYDHLVPLSKRLRPNDETFRLLDTLGKLT